MSLPEYRHLERKTRSPYVVAIALVLLVVVLPWMAWLTWRVARNGTESPDGPIPNVGGAAWKYDEARQGVVVVESRARGATKNESITNAATSQGWRGAGWLFAISSDTCVIVTCAHVAPRGMSITVSFADGTEHEAQHLGIDEDHDVAVLRVNASAPWWKSLQLAAAAHVNIGDEVFAMGHPAGLRYSLTPCSVSGLDRDVYIQKTGKRYSGLIQLSLPLDYGNSGGPLLDHRGRLIGMNALVWDRYSFAIPIEDVEQIARRLIREAEQTEPATAR